jgi:hypothetical protein
MKQFFVQIIAMLLLPSFSLLASSPFAPSNASIFKKLSKDMSACIVTNMSKNTLQLNIIGGSEEKEFLRSEFMSEMKSIEWSMNADSKLIITPSEMRTVYQAIDDDDSVKRTCLLNAEIRFESSSMNRIIECKAFQHSDTIARALIPSLEIPSYPFCIGAVPAKESTIFDGIIKPALYVLTFGFSAYLLFGVRSSD